MPRAGGGTGGGGRSSGGHSSSRAGSGHRVSGGRAGSFNNSHSSHYRAPKTSVHNHYYGMPGMFFAPRRRRASYMGGTGCAPVLIVVLIFLALIIIFSAVNMSSSKPDIPKSTANREKAETGIAFQNNCVIDELGWVDNVSKTERRLKNFYDKTGVQPFIYLKAYDPRLSTDSKKQEFALQWYEDNIDNEGTFLYVYFAERNTDSDVGYMYQVNGKQISSVMDAEAVDIFWAYLDSVWYGDMSTDDVFVSAFDNTAQRIMTKTTTDADIMLWVVIFAGAALTLALVIKAMKLKRRHDKEANEEAERILKTPLGTYEDDLADKYTKNTDNGKED